MTTCTCLRLMGWRAGVHGGRSRGRVVVAARRVVSVVGGVGSVRHTRRPAGIYTGSGVSGTFTYIWSTVPCTPNPALTNARHCCHLSRYSFSSVSYPRLAGDRNSHTVRSAAQSSLSLSLSRKSFVPPWVIFNAVRSTSLLDPLHRRRQTRPTREMAARNCTGTAAMIIVALAFFAFAAAYPTPVRSL